MFFIHWSSVSIYNPCAALRNIAKTQTYTILPKVLAPLLMKGLTTLVISMSTNLNVEAYSDILGNLILYQQFGQNSFLF